MVHVTLNGSENGLRGSKDAVCQNKAHAEDGEDFEDDASCSATLKKASDVLVRRLDLGAGVAFKLDRMFRLRVLLRNVALMRFRREGGKVW